MGRCGQGSGEVSLLGQALDLYELWRAVAQRGGHEEVRPSKSPLFVLRGHLASLTGAAPTWMQPLGNLGPAQSFCARSQGACLLGHCRVPMLLVYADTTSKSSARPQRPFHLWRMQRCCAHSFQAGAGHKAQGVGPHRARPSKVRPCCSSSSKPGACRPRLGRVAGAQRKLTRAHALQEGLDGHLHEDQAPVPGHL